MHILGIKSVITVTVHKIPNIKKDSLQKPNVTQEIWNAVQQEARLTLSGVDGISHEFYLTMWETIKNDLTNLYNLMFQTRRTTPPPLPPTKVWNNRVHT